MSAQYDVIIIGAGPGGYVAAIRAAQLGFKVAIIEREHLGGICLNWGCIPTKALLRSAQVKNLAGRLSSFGLKLEGNIEPDIAAIVARSRSVASRLNGGVGFLMKKNKIDIIWGQARLQKKETGVEIRVSEAKLEPHQPAMPTPSKTLGAGTYQAKHIILATGARPRILNGFDIANEDIWSYFEALVPQKIPDSLLVIGSGAIGIEFASFYNAMGTKVTVVERLGNILTTEDEEISELALKELEAQGIKILTNTNIIKLEKQGQFFAVVLDENGVKHNLVCEKLIAAIGVVPNIEGLGLEDIGVEIKGNIRTDEWSRTNIANIYAIGDVAGAPMLAHKAEEEGVICVEKIADLPTAHPLDRSKIPSCIYCEPQIASVGLTEKAALEQGYNIKIGRYNFAANGKAIALGEEHGLIKTIFDSATGQLLGAHMLGAEVTELIQGFVIAMNLETTEDELMKTIFPHPTLSEMMKESVLDAYDIALNA